MDEDFDYAEEFKKLDVEALKQDVIDVDGVPVWPTPGKPASRAPAVSTASGIIMLSGSWL
jgi:hypothetical protein